MSRLSLALFVLLMLTFVCRMVTTVVGQLGEGVRPLEAMMRAFPPGEWALLLFVALARYADFLELTGSMTGAPKLRSLQLLDELEQRQDRGAYSGADPPAIWSTRDNNTDIKTQSGVFGYLAVDGASDWSVVIRTLVKRGCSKSPLCLFFPSRCAPRLTKRVTSDLTLGGGGAITHKSVAENEWEEVLTKVDAVLGRTRP